MQKWRLPRGVEGPNSHAWRQHRHSHRTSSIGLVMKEKSRSAMRAGWPSAPPKPKELNSCSSEVGQGCGG